jgi:hypothetical protein
MLVDGVDNYGLKGITLLPALVSAGGELPVREWPMTLLQANCPEDTIAVGSQAGKGWDQWVGCPQDQLVTGLHVYHQEKNLTALGVRCQRVRSVTAPSSLNGQQNTGFAFKRGLTVVRQPDVTALDVRGDGRLRYGSRIDVTHQGQTFQLLSVPLKSGCFENASTSSDCALLLEQIPVLEGWIDAAAQGPTPFIGLGDFNRRVTQPNDQVWADLDDGEPTNANLTTLTQDMPVSCRDNTFTEFIDHIVVDRRVLPWVDRTSFRQVTYRQADKAVWNQLSDHCPVLVELWVR